MKKFVIYYESNDIPLGECTHNLEEFDELISAYNRKLELERKGFYNKIVLLKNFVYKVEITEIDSVNTLPPNSWNFVGHNRIASRDKDGNPLASCKCMGPHKDDAEMQAWIEKRKQNELATKQEEI